MIKTILILEAIPLHETGTRPELYCACLVNVIIITILTVILCSYSFLQ